MNNLYKQKKVFSIMIFIVLLGALNWGILNFLNINIVELIGQKTDPIVSKGIYALVSLCALLLITDRNVYLPFLGDSVFPCGNLKEKVPANSDTSVEIFVEPNDLIVYWGSNPDNQELKVIDNPWNAYQNYENSGVVRANGKGKAILRLKKPVPYKIPNGRELRAHIHYRVCKGNGGMLSEVRTKYL